MRKIIGFVISICMVIALVGCGSEGGYIDTSSESKESESSSMTENSETQSSQDSQIQSETETQKPSESVTQEPSETETQKPSETETQEPSETETQKPSESVTQEPSETETQKPSESETQKPSESETQEPSETETQEPNESETEEPSEQYEEYILSTQSYDFAEQVSEKYYLVGKDELYGLVDFKGNEIVPIQYEEYIFVAEDEIEFEDWDDEAKYEWNYAYVYNTNTGKRILKYKTHMQPAREEDYCEQIIVDEVEHNLIYSSLDPIVENDETISTTYQNGLMMEQYEVYDFCKNYQVGYVPRYHVSFKNAQTGELIYEGYTVFDDVPFEYYADDGWEIGYEEGQHPFYTFSYDTSEGKAAMLEYSIQEDEYYLVVVGLDGYVKQEIKDISIFDSSVSYSNDWMKMPWTAKMINTKTMEIIDMSIEEETTERWYFGIGEYYAITEFGDDTIYTIYKGATVIGTGYRNLYFSKYYILGKRDDGKYAFIDYDGNEQLLVDDYSGLLNDRYLVNDGVGVYYVDKNLKKVSDYIYKGDVENCHSGAIMIDGKYYLIAKK